MPARIHVGTSGYSFPDWIGTVYPPQARAADLLVHYATLFDAVEVNTTHYRIPSPRTFAGMMRRVPREFSFAVKLPREATHEREGLDSAVRPFLDAIAPLEESGQLGPLLAQFPYSFRPSPASLDHLLRVRDAFLTPSRPVQVEFRHAGWYDEATYRTLADLGLGVVNVDLPPLKDLPGPTNVWTTPIAYYRLHGRNTATWWEQPTPSDRYDYLYSDEELEDWALRVEQAAQRTTTCYVFANNCHLGQSVVNALQLRRRLGVRPPAAPPGRPRGMFDPSPEQEIAALRERIMGARRARAE